MRTFEITQEQILQIHNSGKIDLKRWFPEAFEPKLEVGKWYKNKYDSLFWIMNYQGDGVGYGFNTSRIYGIDYRMDCNVNWKEATPQEVETALINEAKKRGYKPGVFCEFGIAKDIREIKNDNYRYHEGLNALLNGNDCIFQDGKWSPIIIETITKSEAEKILNKKII